ncbi:unnamed protein product, partial [Notodromas monacha]
MAVVEFRIPGNLRDLVGSADEGNFAVSAIYNAEDLPYRLRDALDECQSNGCAAVVDNFDVLYSTLLCFKDLEGSSKRRAWEFVVTAVRSLGKDLVYLNDEKKSLDPDRRAIDRNLMKMTSFLACELAELFEQETFDSKLTKSNKKGQSSSVTPLDWSKEKLRMISALISLCGCSLNRLFDPPLVDPAVVNAYGNLACSILRDPTILHVKSVPLKNVVFDLIGVLVRRFSHQSRCALNLVQGVQLYEHFADVAVDCLSYLLGLPEKKEYMIFASSVVTNIAQTNPEDVNRDVKASKGYSSFLMSLARKQPGVFKHAIKYLIEHLEGESHNMRIAVLTVLKECIRHLTTDEMTEEDHERVDEYFQFLCDHTEDVISFVRKDALSLLAELAMPRNMTNDEFLDAILAQVAPRVPLETYIPVVRYAGMVKICDERMFDKASTVRKAATNFLRILTIYNPYYSCFGKENLDTLIKEREEKLQQKINELKPAEHSEAETERLRNLLLKLPVDAEEPQDVPHQDGELSIRGVKLLFHAYQIFTRYHGAEPPVVPAELDPQTAAIESDDVAKLSEIRLLRRNLEFLRAAIEYRDGIKHCMGQMCKLLRSTAASDVTEAIRYFTETYTLNMDESLLPLRRMLMLMKSKDESIVKAVREAYELLYLRVQFPGEMDPSEREVRTRLQIVKNLSEIVLKANQGELAALELLVQKCYEEGKLDAATTDTLWDRFAYKIAGTTPEHSHCALILLGMATSADPTIGLKNLDVFVEYGLKRAYEVENGCVVRTNLSIAADVLQVLRKLVYLSIHGTKPSTSSLAPKRGKKTNLDATPEPNPAEGPRFSRFPSSHPVIQETVKLVKMSFFSAKDRMYAPMAAAAVKFIFIASQEPLELCKQLVHLVTAAIRTSDENSPSQDFPPRGMMASVLTRSFALLGELALGLAEYLDMQVRPELRRREQEKQREKDERRRKAGMKPSSVVRNKRMSVRSEKLGDLSGDFELDLELGLAAANCEDAVSEAVREICEKKIVTGNGWLAQFAPLILLACKDPDTFRQVDLRRAAIVALGKYMLVSKSFCEQHAVLLFTIMEKDPDEIIRSNCVVLACDLAVRFPKQIDPYTNKIFLRLSDECLHVRLTALKLITEMILNDIFKVRGYIADVARCIVDDDLDVSSLTREFFRELSKKNNMLYNTLPDLISGLMDPTKPLEQEEFQIITRFVFSLIDKDKQMEVLVEKICGRLGAAITDKPQQWENLAYCLGLIKYNEKTLKKLMENFACFKSKLHVNGVHNTLLAILTQAKGSMKDRPVLLGEFENLVQQEREKSVGDKEAVELGHEAQNQARQKKATGKKDTRRQLREITNTPSDDEDFAGGDADEEPPASRSRPARRKAVPSRRALSDDEDNNEQDNPSNDSDDDNGSVAPPPRLKMSDLLQKEKMVLQVVNAELLKQETLTKKERKALAIKITQDIIEDLFDRVELEHLKELNSTACRQIASEPDRLVTNDYVNANPVKVLKAEMRKLSQIREQFPEQLANAFGEVVKKSWKNISTECDRAVLEHAKQVLGPSREHLLESNKLPSQVDEVAVEVDKLTQAVVPPRRPKPVAPQQLPSHALDRLPQSSEGYLPAEFDPAYETEP